MSFNPFKTSKLGAANFWLVQFLGVRIYWYEDDDGTTGYGILGFTLPFSGWWGKYTPKPRKYWKLSANTKNKN